MDALAHGTPLSPTARAIVQAERPGHPQHLGAVFLLHPGSGVTIDAVRELVAARLHLVPHLRRKLWRPPVPRAQPLWVDDHEFELEKHVRAVRVTPGAEADRDLAELCGRLLSTAMPRERSPWDLLLVEGLANDRSGIVVRSHLALGDVAHGLELGATLLGLNDADATIAGLPVAWEPEELPGRRSMLVAAVKETVPTADALLARAKGAVASGVAGQLRRGAGKMWGRAVGGTGAPTAVGPLRGRPGAGRTVAFAELDLDRIRALHGALGVSVHDVVLAIVARATGGVLSAQGVDTEGRWLRVLAPVAVNADGLPGVASSFVSVPLGEDDAVERVRIVAEATSRVRTTHRALPAGALDGIGAVAPSVLHAAAVQLAARAPSYDLLVSNVPGPRERMHALGGALVAAFPLLPLGGDHAVAVGCTSVESTLCVSITGAPGAEAKLIPGLLREALDELEFASSVKPSRLARPARQAAQPRPAQAS